MQAVLTGAAIGVIATGCLDIWAAFVKHVLRLPTANWGLVGRWFGHMPRGVFVHDAIAKAPPVTNEVALGWFAHYAIGVVYGLAYILVVRAAFGGQPSLATALGFGLATVVAPWLILQPGMGAGLFASRTPRPWLTRAVNVSMHAVFGISLYAGWLLVG